MTNSFCFDKGFFIILTALIVVIMIILVILFMSKSTFKCPQLSCPSIKCPSITLQDSETVNEPKITESSGSPGPYTDPVREYDYRKIYDPLEEPTRRVDRYQIPPAYFKRFIDIPSRGYPDNFSQVGILVRIHNDHNRHGHAGNASHTGHSGHSNHSGQEEMVVSNQNNSDNNILRLFSRQEYPGSWTRFEYYTALNSGFDSIKIPIDAKRNRELYDGDTVYIKELNQTYKVQLYNYDSPRYYPDLF